MTDAPGETSLNKRRNVAAWTMAAALTLGAFSALPAKSEDAAFTNELGPNPTEKDDKVMGEQARATSRIAKS